jgi:UDP-glucuronate 4-epimerase
VDNFDPFYARKVKERNLDEFRSDSRCRFIEADIRDVHANRSLAGCYDAIIHLAAKAGVRPSILDPLSYQSVNVAGTQSLLEAAREWGVKHFVFASSSSVYGVNPKTPWSEDDHALLPISPYASTKVSGELLGHVYSHLYGIRFVALRFFTVYGPRQRPDLAIRKFADLILRGLPISVYGDGSMSRDYTYVEDIVDGICAAVQYRKSAYEVFNLGNNHTVSIREMVARLEQSLRVPARIQFLPEQAGDVPITCADIRKAQSLLGYAPRVPFAEGIGRFTAWLLSEEPGRIPCPAQAQAFRPEDLTGNQSLLMA